MHLEISGPALAEFSAIWDYRADVVPRSAVDSRNTEASLVSADSAFALSCPSPHRTVRSMANEKRRLVKLDASQIYISSSVDQGIILQPP